MKRKKLQKNSYAVSNVIAYIFSLSVASMVMLSSVLITDAIIDEKASQIAGQQAQSLANQIGYGILEAMASVSSNPGVRITKTIDLPLDIADRSFYIEISENSIFVNTTDGLVSKKSSNYNANERDIGINSKEIKSGSNEIIITYKKPDYVYKFDFGVGDITSHSPVESSYFIVTNQDPSGGWYDGNSPYRIPIEIINPTSEIFSDTVIRIILNNDNFKYDFADVTTYSSPSESHKVDSDIIFVDSSDNEIDYFIDLWNPKGESIILLKMDISSDSNEVIYLYYGSGSVNTHNIDEISIFSDNFNGGSIDSNIWNIGGSPSSSGGMASLNDDDFIISKIDCIKSLIEPSSVPESVNTSGSDFIVTGRIDISEDAEADMIILSYSNNTYLDGCYLPYITNETTQSRYSISKYSPNRDLDVETIPKIDNWILMDCIFNISNTKYPGSQLDIATAINTYYFNSENFGFISELSCYDTDPESGETFAQPPHQNGSVGLGCGIKDPTLVGQINIDWIRLINTTFNKIITNFGPIESNKFSWDNYLSVNAENYYNQTDLSNLFYPGPLLSDFNHGTSDSIFEVQGLNEGDYTVTITMGNYSNTCNEMEVQFRDSGGGSYGSLTIPSTEKGEFKSKSHAVNNFPNGESLQIEFKNPSWIVNSIVIEGGEKGVNIEEN
jgi:hypothetical protein